MGFEIKNYEQKIRITLSNRALLTMADDMNIFKVSKASSFINTVFENYKSEAKSSISLYLQQREIELDRMLAETELDAADKKIVIERFRSTEKQEIENKIKEYRAAKGKSKLYHINNNNKKYLEDCDEAQYYRSPGLYIRSVIEEYCSLPFIKREHIYRKKIYDTIEQACREQRVLKIKAMKKGKELQLYVYPYKIVPDFLHTQSYLVCYSYRTEQTEKDKIVGSFSMVRVNMPTMLKQTFHLNKQEKNYIENQISKYSSAYLTEQPEQIKVRLTEEGKDSYRSRLYSRPEKDDSLSSDDVYVFECTEQQIFDYFFSFGAKAEILSPERLRKRFKNTHNNALKNYSK